MKSSHESARFRKLQSDFPENAFAGHIRQLRQCAPTPSSVGSWCSSSMSTFPSRVRHCDSDLAAPSCSHTPFGPFASFGVVMVSRLLAHILICQILILLNRVQFPLVPSGFCLLLFFASWHRFLLPFLCYIVCNASPSPVGPTRERSLRLPPLPKSPAATPLAVPSYHLHPSNHPCKSPGKPVSIVYDHGQCCSPRQQRS